MKLVRAALFLKERFLSGPQGSFELPVEISDNETSSVEREPTDPMVSLSSGPGLT